VERLQEREWLVVLERTIEADHEKW
jgi:hypothetical protein